MNFCQFCIFAGKVMISYSSNWFTLLLLCISGLLVLCGGQFDHGSRQVKREPVDPAMEDYDVSLCQQIGSILLSQLYWFVD